MVSLEELMLIGKFIHGLQDIPYFNMQWHICVLSFISFYTFFAGLQEELTPACLPSVRCVWPTFHVSYVSTRVAYDG